MDANRASTTPVAAGPRQRVEERGAILMVLVIGMVVMMIILGQAAQAWTTIVQRDREEEFLSRGRQIVHAIQRFQADRGSLPTILKQLHEPGPKGNSRYIRKPWKDPLTGNDFVLLWLAPSGASLFRSDGKPSITGSLGNTPGGGVPGNQETALNLQGTDLAGGMGAAGGAGGRGSLLDAFNKSKDTPIGQRGGGGAMQQFGANPELNLGNFDTGSDLLNKQGAGPIVGVATALTGPVFKQWKRQTDYAGYEVSIFSFMENPTPQNQQPVQGTAPGFGQPIPGPLTPEGRKLRGNETDKLQGLNPAGSQPQQGRRRNSNER